MSWITVIWSAAAGACVIMGLMHFLVWCRERRSWADLCFFVMVAGVLGLIVAELVMMFTGSPYVYGRALRWVHLVNGLGIIGSLGFVHFYFGTGRPWLLLVAFGLRMLVVVTNFASGMNLQLRSIESLRTIEFLGETVSILDSWQTNPWFVLGPIATLVQVAYMVDAAVRLWRTGSRDLRRRALIVAGALAVFYLGGTIVAALTAAGVLRAPLIVSLPFVVMLLAMSYELSGETLRAVSLGQAVRERDVDLSLAADSAKLGFWTRDLTNNEIRATETFRAMYGFTPTEELDVDTLRRRLHPDDRERLGGGDGAVARERRRF